MKMRPKKFTEEQLKALQVESMAQTTEYTVEKTTDPENFPVFKIPVNKKVLVYVPNHVVQLDDDMVWLRMDMPIIHTVKDGRAFRKIRCIKDLSEKTGYGIECPFCGAVDDCYTLANLQINDACNQRGLDPNNIEQEDVKELRRKYFSARPIKNGDRYYTFPITVIETDPKNIKKIITDENGMPVYKHMWYTCSKTTYTKKWEAALEAMEDEPPTPAGRTFVLDYTYESATGDYNRMTSAKELRVIAKKIAGSEGIFEKWDKETEEWTPLKAQETIYDNMYYEEEDLVEEVERIMVPIKENIVMYQMAEGSPAAIGGKAQAGIPLRAPAGSNMATEDEGLPLVGQTDED